MMKVVLEILLIARLMLTMMKHPAYGPDFVPPIKLFVDESFYQRALDAGIEDIRAFVSSFLNNSPVEIVKTRCFDYPMDAEVYVCMHKGRPRIYRDCLKSLFGHYNPKHYVFATASDGDLFAQQRHPRWLYHWARSSLSYAR